MRDELERSLLAAYNTASARMVCSVEGCQCTREDNIDPCGCDDALDDLREAAIALGAARERARLSLALAGLLKHQHGEGCRASAAELDYSTQQDARDCDCWLADVFTLLTRTPEAPDA